MDNVLVYRESLLPISETFILAQSEALTRYRAHYVGLSRTDGLITPEERTHLLSLGELGRWPWPKFKYFGRVPAIGGKGLQSLRPVLIHTHFGTNAPDGMWLADYLDLPLVVTFHGFDATTRGPETIVHSEWWPYRLLRRRVARRATRLIAVSDFIAGRLIQLGFPEAKIVRHYIGITPQRQPCLPLSRRGSTVLFVGRLVEKKGLRHVLQAMVPVQAAHSDIELVIIGDGPLRSSLEQLARSLGVRARFLGAQPKAAVAEWMGSSRVLCQPSITAANGDSEGLPMVTLESMAAGTPVVGFRHAGIPEAVIHGQTGMLVPEGDVAGLAQGILHLLEDDVQWLAMSVAGRQRVEDHFNLARQSVLLEDIYREAISTFRRRPA